MDDWSDFDLRRPVSEPQPPPAASRRRPIGFWIVVALVIAASSGAAYVACGMRSRSRVAPVTETRANPSPALQPRSLGGEAERIPLPPLEETDPLVRKLVRSISESPAIINWLATNGLIRNFAVVVANIADGATPVKHLQTLRPSVPFVATQRGGRWYLDPRNCSRYDRIADAVDAADPTAAARVYATLKPRIEEAYGDLGYPRGSFDRALERAIVTLLGTPIVDAPLVLRPKGIGYAYADERLEDLNGAQKQLLRMGPRNVRIIEERLRAIGLALGIRPQALPGG